MHIIEFDDSQKIGIIFVIVDEQSYVTLSDKVGHIEKNKREKSSKKLLANQSANEVSIFRKIVFSDWRWIR